MKIPMIIIASYWPALITLYSFDISIKFEFLESFGQFPPCWCSICTHTHDIILPNQPSISHIKVDGAQ